MLLCWERGGSSGLEEKQGLSASELSSQVVFATLYVLHKNDGWKQYVMHDTKKKRINPSVCFPLTYGVRIVSTSNDPHLPVLSSLYTFKLCMASKTSRSSNYHGSSQLSIWQIQNVFCCQCPMNGNCYLNDFFCLLSSRCQLGSLLSLTSYILVWLIAFGW